MLATGSWAVPTNTYCVEYLNPFLNFHQPTMPVLHRQARPLEAGRIKRIYRPQDAMTPLDKLANLLEENQALLLLSIQKLRNRNNIDLARQVGQ